ncbi:MAG: class I SAM-dependent methyltransferase, partial [Planctomycetota bacterium]
LVLEFSRPRMPGLRQVYSFYFKRVLPRVGQFFARNDKSAYKYLPQSVSDFPDYEALAKRMTATGLTHVQFRPLTIGVATIYWGDKPSQENAGDTGANISGANNSGASSRP